MNAPIISDVDLKDKIRIISAGAGSGKTFRICEVLTRYLQDSKSGVNPDGIIATTFTVKAAEELRQRIRTGLYAKGLHHQALMMETSYIGTVNSICGRLLERFSFQLGLSPELDVISEEDQKIFFKQSISLVLTDTIIQEFEDIGGRIKNAHTDKVEDWRSDLNSILERIRSNNLSTQDIEESKIQSIKSLLQYFPTPGKIENFSNDKLHKILKKTILDLKDQIESKTDTTKVTAGKLKQLEMIQNHVEGGGHLTWSEWIGLLSEPGVKSRDYVEELFILARNFLSHPQLHEDIRLYTTLIFDLASDALQAYASFKKDRGLIDFIDQESLCLQLLDLPDVRDELKDELSLLVVDEFQDTSPIQLSLFLKLAELSQHTIFVGDPKQSIYGFRGADPELMEAVLSQIKQPNAEDILSVSYRSRPDLVTFVNEIYVHALKDRYPEEQVALDAHRTDTTMHLALEKWNCSVADKNTINATDKAMCLASGVAGLLNRKIEIADPVSNTARQIRANDIAILCRTNKDCAQLAIELANVGVESSRSRVGLLQTPEIRLVIAALRTLLYSYDSLAVAEMILLTADQPDVESLLQERFDYLNNDGKSGDWNKNHPIIEAIETLTQLQNHLGPSALLDVLINRIQLRHYVTGWGRLEERLGNIEELRRLAREYEEHSLSLKSGCSAAGFILWLEDLSENENDFGGESSSENAVKISTYHGAKGLEWPIVICYSLQKNTSAHVFGTKMIAPDLIDLQDPLKDRKIRFWLNPFGLKKNIPDFSENIEDEIIASKNSEAREEMRLLYVGLTRARDQLILVSTNNKNPWLDLPFERGEIPAISAITNDGKQVWDSGRTKIPFMNRITTAGMELENHKIDRKYPALGSGIVKHEPAFTYPSLITLPESVIANCKEPIVYGDRITITGKVEMDKLGNSLHAFLAADNPKIAKADRLAMCDHILDADGFNMNLKSDQILKQSELFSQYVESTWSPIKTFTEWPLFMRQVTGQVLNGVPDLVIEQNDGWVIIDHKAFPGSKDKMKEHAIGYAGQLYAYKQMLEAATDKTVMQTWIHYFVSGSLVEIGFE